LISPTFFTNITQFSAGYPRTYGRPEPQKLIAAEIGRTKRSRDPARTKKHANDGRAPDTTAQAPDLRKIKRTKTDPFNATTSASGFAFSPLSEADDVVVQSASDIIIIDGARRKFQLPGPKALYYVSYTWSNNSCWLDVSLELLFVISQLPYFKHFWDQIRQLPPTTATTPVSFNVVGNHFDFRVEKGTLNPPAELRELLGINRDVIHKQIMGNSYGQMSSTWVC
jgi:hypothetical protein